MKTDELTKVLEEHRKWRLDSTTGKRADLGGADLGGAYLRGAYLRGANLRGADLGGAEHCIRLDMVDPREYKPVAVATDEGWRIYSGCRSFTVEEALCHWGDTYQDEREIGDRYLRAIKTLPECPAKE